MSRRAARTILVTGSSGLIGTNLGLHLLERGDRVVGVDLRANAWTDCIPTLRADLRGFGPEQTLLDFLEDSGVGHVDAVVHLAAIARVHASVCEPEGALGNVQMLHNVLEFARTLRRPIIFASSREVYGQRPARSGPTGEECVDHRRAASPYAACKIAAESLLASYASCFELDTIVFRFSNVYGRFDSDIDRIERVIPLFFDRIASGDPITIYGPEKVLDFTYVDDTVAGIIAGLDRLCSDDPAVRGTVAGATINIASGRGSTLIELAELIGEQVGQAPIIREGSVRRGEITRYVADLSTAERLLAYRPQHTLPTGLVEAAAWRRASVCAPRPIPAPSSEVDSTPYRG